MSDDTFGMIMTLTFAASLILVTIVLVCYTLSNI
jgi:hypothetical protein